MHHSLPSSASRSTDCRAHQGISQIAGLNRSNDTSADLSNDPSDRRNLWVSFAYAWTGSAIVNRPYTSNGLNQLTLSGTIVPTYDAARKPDLGGADDLRLHQ